MPIYEYVCSDCAKRFEQIRPFNDRNAPMLCECGAPATLAVSVPARAQVPGGTWAGTSDRRCTR